MNDKPNLFLVAHLPKATMRIKIVLSRVPVKPYFSGAFNFRRPVTPEKFGWSRILKFRGPLQLTILHQRPWGDDVLYTVDLQV